MSIDIMFKSLDQNVKSDRMNMHHKKEAQLILFSYASITIWLVRRHEKAYIV